MSYLPADKPRTTSSTSLNGKLPFSSFVFVLFFFAFFVFLVLLFFSPSLVVFLWLILLFWLDRSTTKERTRCRGQPDIRQLASTPLKSLSGRIRGIVRRMKYRCGSFCSSSFQRILCPDTRQVPLTRDYLVSRCNRFIARRIPRRRSPLPRNSFRTFVTAIFIEGKFPVARCGCFI